MTYEETRKSQFARHYQQLEIDDGANWGAAKYSYRRLVHVWHPDKFSNRPRERIHAQQRFINLTKSYHALRDFYRTNHRLPFQSIPSAGKAQTPAQPFDPEPRAVPICAASLNSSVLSRDPVRLGLINRHSRKILKMAWPLACFTVMVATITFFMILDRKENQATVEIGLEAVRDAPPSEFMPSVSDIRKSQARGAFVKPAQ